MYNLNHQINHSLVFIDSAADPQFPISKTDEQLWDQGNIQLATPLVSECCNAMVIDHKQELYCSACGQELTTGKTDAEVTNLITH